MRKYSSSSGSHHLSMFSGTRLIPVLISGLGSALGLALVSVSASSRSIIISLALFWCPLDRVCLRKVCIESKDKLQTAQLLLLLTSNSSGKKMNFQIMKNAFKVS